MLEDPFTTDAEREAEAKSERAYWRRVAVFVVVVVLLGAAAAGALRKAFAASPSREAVIVDCGALAENITLLADFRDTGARLELVVRLARERQGDGPLEKVVLER